MARITVSFLRAKLNRFANDFNYTVCAGYTRNTDGKMVSPVGAIFLDKSPAGKWRIAQYCNEAGGERHLTGWSNDMTASELVAWFEGAEFALYRIPKS